MKTEKEIREEFKRKPFFNSKDNWEDGYIRGWKSALKWVLEESA